MSLKFDTGHRDKFHKEAQYVISGKWKHYSSGIGVWSLSVFWEIVGKNNCCSIHEPGAAPFFRIEMKSSYHRMFASIWISVSSNEFCSLLHTSSCANISRWLSVIISKCWEHFTNLAFVRCNESRVRICIYIKFHTELPNSNIRWDLFSTFP